MAGRDRAVYFNYCGSLVGCSDPFRSFSFRLCRIEKVQGDCYGQKSAYTVGSIPRKP